MVKIVKKDEDNVKDVVPQDVPEEPKPVEEEKPAKKGIFRKIGSIIIKPVTWTWGKIKAAPGSAAIGAVIGAGGTIGGIAAYNHFAGRRNDGSEEGEIRDDSSYTDEAESYTDEAV